MKLDTYAVPGKNLLLVFIVKSLTSQAKRIYALRHSLFPYRENTPNPFFQPHYDPIGLLGNNTPTHLALANL